MASSGRITGSFSGGSASARFTYICAWDIQSQDTAARTSYVRFQWIVYKTNYAYRTYKANAPWAQNINGQYSDTTINFDSPASLNNQEQVVRTTYATIPHEADGTKSFSVSSTLDLSGTSAGTGNLLDNIVLDPIAVNPPVVNTLTISDIGTGYSSVGAYVAGFTKLRLTATATQGDGALATYSFYRGTTLLGTVTTSATTATLDMTTFESAGSFVYSVTVTDAYGLSGSKALSATTINAYTMPTITATTYRSNSSGTADNEGTYGYCNMSYTVASVGSNSAVVHSVTINGNSYSTFPSIVSGLATTASYDAVYLVTDKLGKSATITQSVQVSFINFDMYPSSNGGAAFGEAAQEDKFIVNQSESIFRGSVNIAVPLALASGGTGGMSVVNHSLTTTAYSYGNYTSKTYTVSGSGILIASCTTKTDATDSYGITVATVRKNGTMVAYATDRIEPAVAQEVAANAVVTISVANGDTVFLGGFSTKVGTKTFLFNILCFGCTVS